VSLRAMPFCEHYGRVLIAVSEAPTCGGTRVFVMRTPRKKRKPGLIFRAEAEGPRWRRFSPGRAVEDSIVALLAALTH